MSTFDPPDSSTKPSKGYGAGAKLLALLGAVLSAIYIVNPTAGFIEFIPDNIPGIGNLDEAAVTGILIYCLTVLGVKLPFGGRKKEAETEMKDVGPKR